MARRKKKKNRRGKPRANNPQQSTPKAQATKKVEAKTQESLVSKHMRLLSEEHTIFNILWGWTCGVLLFTAVYQWFVLGILNVHSIVALGLGVVSLLAVPYTIARYAATLFAWIPAMYFISTNINTEVRGGFAVLILYLSVGVATIAYMMFQNVNEQRAAETPA